MGLTAISLDGLHQWLELVRAAASDAGDEPFLGKPLGNGAARGITCADDQYDLLVILGLIPLVNDR